MVSTHINNKLLLLPDLPGCYLMKNKEKEIIYIGKAKNLKKRVRSYFRGTHEGKTQLLVEEIVDFETIITSTDKECLLLEITLIKKHLPKYNIKLKQGTSYPYLKITNEKDPQLIITSEVKRDGGYYFGPYPNVYAASETQQFIQKVYPLRKCNGYQKRACLYYHLGQCIGPCDHEIPKEEYDAQIDKIRRFLNGDVKEIKKILKNKMMQAAEELAFERAAEYRNQIQYIETTVERQNIITNDFTTRDVFSYYMNKGWISIQVFFIRQATLIKREATIFPCYDTPQEELASYIVQFYQEDNHLLPKEVLVPNGVDTKTLSEVLEIPVKVPIQGRKKDMLDLATKNSEISLNEKFQLIEMDDRKTIGAIKELSEALNLPLVSRIEAFDHSNIQGTNPVSAMVSFLDGKPDKSNYRKYKIKSVSGSNELATTEEVIRRRYARLLKESKPLPDLILMDGGKIQVNGAINILENELGLSIPVAGMVKDDKHRTSSLIFGEELQKVTLKPTSQAFYLVQRIQDEVHRFAITFHRQLRGKNSLSSKLDRIEGVGPKTRTKVLKHFKSVKNVKEASVEEINGLGIPLKTAVRIKEGLE
ncbi:excinuclease ABC subunit UvrC [Carnobacterium viridans]|uniref:UvrABC system protein C n=1 Tax=Carnobacterium viridans TaxID=174587 RepID=A0A1H0Z2C8_9LACT|nr:excinuclease ABC subunit UvrC [Carnobacterium viridans]UDE94831.1 excinuclease ABC subunit UvrC [Carnobacterium viridans]SDQ21544.1 Excinuclease ABC subunit C [Carnobacterium viridans]